MIRSRFESLGVYMPERIMSSGELISKMRVPLNIDIERITGIKKRRIRAGNEDSFTLAVKAAEDCLSRSAYSAADLDVVINTSISRTMDYPKIYDEPSLSYYIKKAIGADRAIHFDISNACAGMMTGGTVLNRMIRSGKVKNGLVVSGESISAITETALKEISGPADPQLASLTVGDSGAAFILDRTYDEPGIELAEMVTIAGFADLCFGLPSSESPGMAMYTKSKEIHNECINRWPACIDSMFRKHGKKFDPAEYDYMITHQTSVNAIKTFIKSGKEYFGCDMPRELYTVEEFANTSSTTHFVLLYYKLREGEIKPGSRVILVSSASGIVLGCISASLGKLEV